MGSRTDFIIEPFPFQVLLPVFLAIFPKSVLCFNHQCYLQIKHVKWHFLTAQLETRIWSWRPWRQIIADILKPQTFKLNWNFTTEHSVWTFHSYSVGFHPNSFIVKIKGAESRLWPCKLNWAQFYANVLWHAIQ